MNPAPPISPELFTQHPSRLEHHRRLVVEAAIEDCFFVKSAIARKRKAEEIFESFNHSHSYKQAAERVH
ncbi:hypothetical protein CH63R_13934 [Colletotrichum higginsianum IMI 349063]|uniref:Transposase n=1 Tax=Colletotrichum higginsianum (strain IMI 349063) TaxID=759273 RepID=A0A1B7XSE2_COLHI|nr:hypothetical protein CH63R_13934 [Colletotrichum higginsianum IMI 349063]OBR02708.1 hypothetical protein CH63R_13934 [Colletotrichum higginsianum IMI 349063]